MSDHIKTILTKANVCILGKRRLIWAGFIHLMTQHACVSPAMYLWSAPSIHVLGVHTFHQCPNTSLACILYTVMMCAHSCIIVVFENKTTTLTIVGYGME